MERNNVGNSYAFEFPTRVDWKGIDSTSPFGQILSLLPKYTSDDDDIDGFAKTIELNNLVYEVQQRLYDVKRSYILMMFYYEKGIPDKRWYISPGKHGESFEYYPDFEKEKGHFLIKEWFDFYSDTLYYKLFSAWDVIGHILNVKYNLELKANTVNFGTAIGALKSKAPNLHANLESVKSSPGFDKANKIRNDITHNYLPNTAGMAIHRGAQLTTVGLKDYAPSEEIVTNVREALDLFSLTLRHISA